MKNLAAKLKDEANLKRLEDQGINVESLKKSLKEKENGTHTGISK